MPTRSIFTSTSSLGFFLLSVLGGVLPTPAQHHPIHTETKPATLLPKLGTYTHPIATANPQAQRFFDQGLMMVFGFNRPEAVRSFRRAAELDPKAAMPHWGMALALGRHLNMEGDMDVQAQAAFQAIGQALALSGSASPVEQAYIQALVKRCAANPQADGQGLDQAYSEAMGELVQQYPDDPDAAALYAESLMNQHRYAWYSAEGNPTQEAQLIQRVLETLLRRHPDHVLANHLYIHLLDMSPHPEYALASAARLATLVPGSGHLLHMASHIWIVLGDYERVAQVNQKAVKADQQYMQLSGVGPNVYTHYGYYPHNLHMLVRARMEQGRFQEAQRVADQLTLHVKPVFEQDPMMIDYYLPNALFVLLRFQRWKEVLTLPAPEGKMFMTRAFYHYGRTLALLATGQGKQALAEKEVFIGVVFPQ